MPTFALNFYSPVVADQLRTGRKTATIRLGDKSPKYKKGMIVTVLVGTRYGAREKIFDAVIDKVEVKPLGELSPREIEHDNPEIRRADELARWLGQLYNRDVSESRHRHRDPLLADHRDDVLTGDLEPASAGSLIAERSLKRITVVPHCESALLPGLADRPTEELGRPHLRPALLALDEERRREPGPARRAEVAHLARRSSGRSPGSRPRARRSSGA